MRYTTDLTEEQFEELDKIIPKSKTRQNKVSKKEILNAIFYQLKNGSQWRDLPKDFPKWKTVYSQFSRWKKEWIFDKILVELEKLERISKEKKRDT